MKDRIIDAPTSSPSDDARSLYPERNPPTDYGGKFVLPSTVKIEPVLEVDEPTASTEQPSLFGDEDPAPSSAARKVLTELGADSSKAKSAYADDTNADISKRDWAEYYGSQRTR